MKTLRSAFPFALLFLLLAGCADKHVTLMYKPDPALAPLPNAAAVTVYQFADRRGDEGDADPYRVGGVYGGYGNRLSKVMAASPWQRSLAAALAAGLTARGVNVVTVEDREFAPGSPITTPLALAGEIRNFSTESRFSTTAHVSGIIRLYNASGAVLVDKMVSDRETWGLGFGVLMSGGPLQDTLNEALAGFVRKVVTDPDLAAKLTGGR